MSGLRKSLLQFVFSGAAMHRWNDKLRPVELYEIDKQAHKMLVAWMFFLLNSEGMNEAQRLALGQEIVEGGLFDYFYRLVITDIKPPVFYRIKENSEDFRRLSAWALGEMERVVRPLDEGMWKRLRAWSERACAGAAPTLADDILRAAHSFASSWEFALIRPLNGFDPELPEIEASFVEILEGLRDRVKGVDQLLDRKQPNALRRFADLCGRLRFQIRWSQTPRMPVTSVLGHMFMVACYSYFFSVTQGVCAARRQNNFFAGLLHDLPEALTRDIISPVKKSHEAISSLIRQYEREAMTEKVLAPLSGEGYGMIAQRLSYFLGLEVGSEFQECARLKGKPVRVDGFAALQERYNENRFDPKDGELIKVCDILAAFMEAYAAQRNGSSAAIQEALWRMRSQLRDRILGSIHLGALLEDFD